MAVTAQAPATERRDFDLEFDVADLVDVTDEPTGPRPGERLHALHESIFGRIGPALVRNGWSCFPQERGERRKPATVDRRALKWKPYQDRLPTEAEVRSWSLQCPGENVAIITGPVSGNLFALDVDVNDPVLSAAVRDCAARFLGDTRFLRFGRLPRVIMLYRTKEGVVLRKKTYGFAVEGDTSQASGDAIEFLANGSPFTAYGIHHKTGDYFKWGGAQPFIDSPEAVPEVTEEAIRDFLRHVQLIRPFHKGRVRGSSCTRGDVADEVAYDESDKGALPRLRDDGAWVWDGGRVVDGRRDYTVRYSYALVRGNENAWRAPDGGEALLREADEHLRATLAPDAEKDTDDLIREFRRIAKADIESMLDPQGKLTPFTLHRQPDGTLVKPGRLLDVTDRDPSLEWLGERDQALDVVGTTGHSNKGVTVTKIEPATPEKKAARALRTDRTEAAAAVKATTEEALDGFFEDVASETATFRVLKAPTGGGKTVLTVSRGILYKKDNKGESRPLIMAMPTHRNVAEAVAVARQARAIVHVPGEEEQVEDEAANAYLRMLRRSSVRAVHWKSKIGAGCLRADEVGAMQAAGMGSDGICGPDPQPGVDEDAEGAPARCPHWHQCGYQRMKAEASRAQVILASHYWVTADRLPRQLADVSGAVIDESVTLAVLQAARVPLSDMRAPRPVHLSKEEWAQIKKRFSDDREREDREAARDALVAEHLAARARAVALLERAGNDLARAFSTTMGALEDAAVAERVCRGAIRGASGVTPDMSREDVLALCDAHRPSPHAALEARLWATVLEAARRFTALGCAHADPATQGPTLHPHCAQEGFVGPLPVTEFEPRLQPLTDTEDDVVTRYWRVSWRRETNWSDKPRLLLDATADEPLVRATFPEVGDDHFKWHQVDTDLNVRCVLIHGRTFSPSSMVPPEGSAKKVMQEADRVIVRAQRIISMVTGAHGHGRTVACLPIRAREAVLSRFARSPTLDSMHFGATRGINAAKAHAAAVGVGRTEWPPWLLDGVVAAATWDRCPQVPMDRLGTGVDDKGKPVRRKPEGRLVRMRDGRDIWIPVPVAPSDWGRRLDAQWREAEMVQFLGRLRPVHRTDTAVYVHACSVFPEGLVWDEVLSVDEMLSRRGHEVWEALVAAGGVVDEVLSPQRLLAKAKVRERVEAFATAYKSCPGFRTLTWTDRACVVHHGLVAVWQDDVRGALEDLGAPQECLDSYVLGPLLEPLRPSTTLEDDRVSERFVAQDELDVLRLDWQVASGRGTDGEAASADLIRFGSEWRRPMDADDLEEAPEEAPEDEDDPFCSTYHSNSTPTDPDDLTPPF